MLGYLALAGQLYTPWRSLHGAECEEQNIERSSAGSRNQKLKGLVIDSSYVKGVPDGMVLDQNPAGGARVKEGRTIYLTVTTS